MIDLKKTKKGQLLIREKRQGPLRFYSGVIVEKVNLDKKIIFGREVDIDENILNQYNKKEITGFSPYELSPLKGVLIGKDQLIRQLQETRKLLFQIAEQGVKNLSPNIQLQLRSYFQRLVEETVL